MTAFERKKPYSTGFVVMRKKIFIPSSSFVIYNIYTMYV